MLALVLRLVQNPEQLLEEPRTIFSVVADLVEDGVEAGVVGSESAEFVSLVASRQDRSRKTGRLRRVTTISARMLTPSSPAGAP